VARWALLLFLSLFSSTNWAYAGDTASLNVLGYSPDGKVFAFEEFGSFDGSGDAYSNIFFLDTEKDQFLPGTPIRVRTEGEQSLAKIRGMSRAKAAPLIEKYQLDDNPGVILAYNPNSEVGSDPHKLRYREYLSSPPSGQTSTLVLTEKQFPPVNDCLNMTGNYTGFTLTLTEYGGNPFNKVLHKDEQIPKSRNCPNGYRLGAVISTEVNGPQIAMILVASFGFEGNDERWIAVPVKPYGP
jgi:predicted secreted protein